MGGSTRQAGAPSLLQYLSPLTSVQPHGLQKRLSARSPSTEQVLVTTGYERYPGAIIYSVCMHGFRGLLVSWDAEVYLTLAVPLSDQCRGCGCRINYIKQVGTL